MSKGGRHDLSSLVWYKYSSYLLTDHGVRPAFDFLGCTPWHTRHDNKARSADTPVMTEPRRVPIRAGCCLPLDPAETVLHGELEGTKTTFAGGEQQYKINQAYLGSLVDQTTHRYGGLDCPQSKRPNHKGRHTMPPRGACA